MKGIKPNIVVFVTNYPAISETYIEVELQQIARHFSPIVIAEVDVKAAPYLAYSATIPYYVTNDIDRITAIVREYQPVYLHGHWLTNAPKIHLISTKTGVPFTIRAHSFDSFYVRSTQCGNRDDIFSSLRSDLCRGIFTFPFFAGTFKEFGVKNDKVFLTPPVVDTELFLNNVEKLPGILNIGAFVDKKNMLEFIDIALISRQNNSAPFNIIPVGIDISVLEKYNENNGSPVRIYSPVPHHKMPEVYGKNSWLLYTACTLKKTIGWPIAISEAMAAGLGICMPNVRDDLQDYVGPTLKIYNSVKQAAEIVASPPNKSDLEAARTKVLKYDIRHTIKPLLQLWQL